MGERETLLALAERCENATGPDRELDRDIELAFPFEDAKHLAVGVPQYTASLDAAMTLVPEGYDVVVGNDQPFCYAAVAPKGMADGPAFTGSTMPLALCAAALRTRAPTGDNDGEGK